MLINLFGVRYGRSPDVDWFDNPHKAIDRCRAINGKKIVWLCYADYMHPQHKSRAWQTIFNLTDFERRILPGFAPPGSPAWEKPEVIPDDKMPAVPKPAKETS